jgi:hypothetical protein
MSTARRQLLLLLQLLRGSFDWCSFYWCSPYAAPPAAAAPTAANAATATAAAATAAAAPAAAGVQRHPICTPCVLGCMRSVPEGNGRFHSRAETHSRIPGRALGAPGRVPGRPRTRPACSGTLPVRPGARPVLQRTSPVLPGTCSSRRNRTAISEVHDRPLLSRAAKQGASWGRREHVRSAGLIGFFLAFRRFLPPGPLLRSASACSSSPLAACQFSPAP